MDIDLTISRHRATRGTVSAVLLFLVVSPVFGQLVFRSPMIQQHDIRAGKIARGMVRIQNITNIPQSARLTVERDKGKRCASMWVTFSEEYILVPAKSTIQIKYKVQIPKNSIGSYWTRFSLAPTAIQKKAGLGVRLKLVGWIIIHTPGGVSRLEFEKVEFRNNSLFAEIRNGGTVVLRPDVSFFCASKEYKCVSRLVFPGQIVRFGTAATDIPKGSHDVFVIAGDEKRGTFGTRWKIEATEAIKEITMIVPVNVRLRNDFGSRGNRLVAQARTQIGHWSLGAGGFFGKGLNRVNLNFGYMNRRLNLYGYLYKSPLKEWRTNLGAFFNLGRWSFSLHTAPLEESGNVQIAYHARRSYFALRASVIQNRTNWNLSVSIPLTLNLKFRKRMKLEHQELKTFIVK